VKVALDDTVTGGTFTLTFNGETTKDIGFDANAQTLKSRLTALSNIDDDDVSVIRKWKAIDSTDLLSDLNSGDGVGTVTGNDLRITLTNETTFVDIDLSTANTIQDVLDAITDAHTNLSADLNSDKTVIEITDTAGGTGNIVVEALNDSTAAADLGIEGSGDESIFEGRLLSEEQGPWTITFIVNSGGNDMPDMTVDGTNLTGGGITAEVTDGVLEKPERQHDGRLGIHRQRGDVRRRRGRHIDRQ
jgi:hypothetical protein